MSNSKDIWTVRKVLDWTREFLTSKGVENSRRETEWLLVAALGLDRIGIYVNFDKPLTDRELAACRELVSRRARREPLQYILGTQEFMGLEFMVNRAVLIPRHDTEVLVTEALKRASATSSILDIGVGSGCIAVSLAKSLPEADVWGVEMSPEALDLARKNAKHHGVTVTLVEGSLFGPVPEKKFDLIVSNPPYIPTAELAILQPEVRDYEPKQALDGGADGLDFYRSIVAAAPSHLYPEGWLMVEVGIGQAPSVTAIFSAAGFFDCFTAHDPAGVERVVGGKFPG